MAGDGIAYALCTSLINSVSLQTFPSRQINSTTVAAPEPCAHTLFYNKVRYINFIIILFFYNRDNTKYDSFQQAGDGIAYAL